MLPRITLAVSAAVPNKPVVNKKMAVKSSMSVNPCSLCVALMIFEFM
jgi:hypothetical protein